MQIYINQGFRDFILAVGYKGNIIKRYFYKNKNFSNINIQIVDTGINSLTGVG